MTTRERILAVLYGRELDRIPVLQYDNLILPNERFWDLYGRDKVGILHRSTMVKTVSKSCSIESSAFTEGRLNGCYNEIRTPKGNIREKVLFDPALNSPSRAEHFISNAADYEILLEYLNDLTVVEDRNRFLTCREYVGDNGIPMVCTNRTPFQQMWVSWVSLEDLCIDLVDHADIVEACMQRLSDIEVEKYKLTARLQKEVPFEIFNFPDNITAPAIGKSYFKKYCISHYNKAKEILDNDSLTISVHMDGDFKVFSDDIKTSAINAIESFTPSPDSDMTISDVLALRDNMKALVNYTSSVHLLSKDKIYQHAIDLLNEGAKTGKMWFQFTEDIPPDRREANIAVILKAVDDFYCE